MSVAELLLLATRNRRRVAKDFASNGVRVSGLNDLLRYLDEVLLVIEAEPQLVSLKFFARRAKADIEISIVATWSGMLTVVADAMRDMMEIHFLLRDFADEPSSLQEWFVCDERERQQRFGPNRLRQRHAARTGVTVGALKDSADYRMHSRSLHVSPSPSPFPRGVAHSPDIMLQVDPALLEIFGHSRSVLNALYGLATVLKPDTVFPAPESARAFQDAADNAQSFTMAMVEAAAKFNMATE